MYKSLDLALLILSLAHPKYLNRIPLMPQVLIRCLYHDVRLYKRNLEQAWCLLTKLACFD
jgi:hypothetical protein